MIVKKTPQQIEHMAAAGALHARCMDLLAENVRVGVTTGELDEIAETFLTENGAVSPFKGYRGFTGSICASPNDMVVHGIPGKTRLRDGDILSIDLGVTLDGWVADAARTFAVGSVSPTAEHLMRVTDESLRLAAEQARPGNRMGDISHAVQAHVEAAGLSVVRDLVGHGVGQDMHEAPEVRNYGPAGKGLRLEEGMVLAIEPMVTAGGPEVYMADDGWSVFTQDGSLAAHFEFTVAVTGDGPRILTPWHLDERSASA